MKAAWLFLPCFFVVAVANAEPWVDQATGLSFPDECGGWTKTETREYAEAGQGFSVSYDNAQGKRLTAYVYTNGFSDIPSGGDNAIVAENIREVAATVTSFWTRDGVTVEEILPVSEIRTEPEGKVKALMTAHRIRLANETRISISAVTGYRGKLLKIRYTYARHVLDEGIADLGRFVTALMAENHATLDDYFASSPVVAADEPTKEDVLQAIRVLDESLLSAEAAAAAALVVAFAEKSTEVVMRIGIETTPWLTESDENDEAGQLASSLLLAVYLAGNTKSQLERGRPDDDILAGWRAVLRAYGRLKKQIAFSSESIEELGRLEAAGELSRHADEVKAMMSREGGNQDPDEPVVPIGAEPAADAPSGALRTV